MKDFDFGIKELTKEQVKELDAIVESRVPEAKVLGKSAFEMGLMCAPAVDTEFMILMRGLPVGFGLPILKAWHTGWAEANLSEIII